MTTPAHPIPAGSPPDASVALNRSVCAAGDVIPAHPPAAGAPAVSAPLDGRGTFSGVALTQHEIRTLDFVREMIATTGSAPTLVEIAADLGLQSRSNAHRIVESLVRAGLLIKTACRLRGLALPDGPLLSSVPTAALRAELARRQEVL